METAHFRNKILMIRWMKDRTRVLLATFGISCAVWLMPIFIIGCGNPNQAEENVVIVVGSTHITEDKLKQDIEFMCSGLDIASPQWNRFRERIIEQIVNHYLVMEYGREKGISVSENELRSALKEIREEYSENAFNEALLRAYVDLEPWKDRLREQMLVNRIMKKVTENIIPPGYQDIKRFFEENREEFKSPKMVRFRQIVTKTGKEAGDLLQRIHSGEEMRDLAKKYSIAPEAEKGGLVGWVALGQLDESMDRVLFSMSQGETSAMVKTPYGYHIFQVLSIRPEGGKELPEVMREIEFRLLNQKREAFVKNWLIELRGHFKVRINQELLNRLEIS